MLVRPKYLRDTAIRSPTGGSSIGDGITETDIISVLYHDFTGCLV